MLGKCFNAVKFLHSNVFSFVFCGKHFDSVQPMPSLYIGLAWSVDTP